MPFLSTGITNFRHKLHFQDIEFIVYSISMKEVIPLMHLLKYLNLNFDLVTTLPEVTCRVFEDNQGCVAIAE